MLKTIMPYAVELNGSLIQSDHGKLVRLNDLGQIKDHCMVVSDFKDSIARVMTVEADTRYVELMISRKLQETGEFDEPVTVISHWKKKRGKNTTDIFFSAMRSKQYLRYLELAGEHDHHFMILPLQSYLYAILKKYGKNLPIAVVFQHDRYADILIGTRKKIWYANRVVAFDNSDEQLKELWETVRSDIETVSHEHHHPIKRLYTINWIDSGQGPEWTDDDAPEVIAITEQSMELDNQPCKVSLPVLIGEISARYAVAPAKEKLFWGARRFLPYFNMIMLLAALLLGGYGLWHQQQANIYADKIDAMRMESAAIQKKFPQDTLTVAYKPTLAFIQTLWTSRTLPTYGQIINDTSHGMDGALTIDNIDANYTDKKVDVKVFGKVNAPFERAHKGFRTLQKHLKKRGYTIEEERFDTRINASSFLIRFTKEV